MAPGRRRHSARRILHVLSDKLQRPILRYCSCAALPLLLVIVTTHTRCDEKSKALPQTDCFPFEVIMRIGTWNCDNAWSDRHEHLLLKEQCDVWLLTEVHPSAVQEASSTARGGAVPKRTIAGLPCHLSSGVMACNQYWAAIVCLETRGLEPLVDPHPATAAAIVHGITYWSTVLPWRSGVAEYPSVGIGMAEKTKDAIQTLLGTRQNLKESQKPDLVWGGDWNHAFIGPEQAGSDEGRDHLFKATTALNLQVPTAGLLYQENLCYSIDHVSVPFAWKIKNASRVMAVGLSKHDAYVIELYEK
jgi:hypothetical protein